MTATPAVVSLTIEDVLQDLEVGRTLPHRPADRLLRLTSRRLPTTGGPRFLANFFAARVLGRIHPRLARRFLWRLWFTPWVHPRSRQPVDVSGSDLRPWSLEHPAGTLRGYWGGSGPTVLLVHGWAGRSADMRHLADAVIADGYRAVAVDLPGHGNSDGGMVSLFDMADALAEVLRHETPIAVVAHSMGFPVTLYALETMDTAPGHIIALAPGRTIRRALEGFASKTGFRPALMSQLHVAIEEEFGVDIWDTLSVDRALPSLDAAGLVVHSDDDEEVPFSDGAYIADAWPAAVLHATSGLGHRAILRDEGVRRLVSDSLS